MNNNEKLIAAAANGQTEAVRALLKMGSDIHADDDAALRNASLAGHFETVTLLLEKGADVHARDKDGRSDAPLHNAASTGQTRIVALLIEKGACIHSSNREGPSAALRNASRGGHCETVKLLLANKAFVYPPDEHGLGCVLCAAAENGHNSTLEILISSSIEVADYLSPAMIWAARSGQEATVDFLREKSADINAPDEWDCPGAPLREAAGNGHVKTVKLLLDHGANFRAPDGYGPESALRVAAIACHSEIITLLLHKYQTSELAEIRTTAAAPQLKDVILKEYKKRLAKAARNDAISQPDLEI
jgi:ankyrin repeat protein